MKYTVMGGGRVNPDVSREVAILVDIVNFGSTFCNGTIKGFVFIRTGMCSDC